MQPRKNQYDLPSTLNAQSHLIPNLTRAVSFLQKSLIAYIDSVKVDGDLIEIKFNDEASSQLDYCFLHSIFNEECQDCKFSLDFSQCHFDNSNGLQLFRMLSNHDCFLKLNVNFQEGATTWRYNSHFLISKTHLQELKFTISNERRPININDMSEEFIDAVKQNHSLCELHLDGCDRSIHEHLENNKLKKQLSENQINPKAIQEVCQKLEIENQSLQEKLNHANEVIEKMERDNQELISENTSLKERLLAMPLQYDAHVVNMQTAIRGFFARKQYQSMKEDYAQIVKQHIEDVQSLMKQGKLSEAMQLIRNKDDDALKNNESNKYAKK